jgi:hypothetical protein
MLGLVLALALAGLSRAADAPRHNRLTPQEIAEGWILLFDGETTFGWQSPNGSKWTIVDGMLAPQADKHGVLVTTTAFRDYDLTIQYRARRDSKYALFVGCNASATGADKILSGKDRGFKTPLEGKEPLERDHPTQVDLQTYGGDQWFESRIQVRNSQMTSVDYYPADSSRYRFARSAREPDRFGKGQEPDRRGSYIALSGNSVIFRHIKLKPVETKPLFNGKDLTGWKKYEGDPKRAKSTFAVANGTITLKDGPGDLQTTGQWADFVLQLECKTNGKHLNSGAFFRCIPGEYQNGYEAQIHNGWLDKPKEVTVEEYDPKTHELKEKRKVQTLAMDFGTGAIYRRMPARKAVAKDGEWFTMTIVAEGNHIATWVDGQQVVDWTDNRPINANPRSGCRLEKGAISLQGHDPTTDLAFRNIRIADLAPVKPEDKEK